MPTRRESNEERYRRERDECRREKNRYRQERDSYKTKLKRCHSELDDYVMLSSHLRNHIKLVETSMVNAIPVQQSVPPELLALIAEPVLSGEVVEPGPEPEPEPETKPERDLVDEMMKLARGEGWDLPPIPGETRKKYFKRLEKYKKGKRSSCCGSRPRKKQTKRRNKKQTKKYKRMR
jgi:hypothetical protein